MNNTYTHLNVVVGYVLILIGTLTIIWLMQEAS